MSTYLEQYREAIRSGEIIAGQELMKEYCVYKHKFPNGKVYIAVVQQSKDGEIISEFFSISEAHRQTGVDIGHICRCCKGGSKTAGGFIWSYVK